jgi:formylglycine-generating enzyme required for sulfatase activity
MKNMKRTRNRIIAMFIAFTAAVSLIPTVAVSASGQSFTEAVGVQFEEELNMIYVQGGTFDMGWTSTTGTQPIDTTRVNGVTVSNYYISETPVTQNLYRAVMGQTRLGTGTGWGQQGNFPQVSVTWYDAQEFLGRLYVLTGKTYRLATDAEWEYAAKGGTHTAGHTMRFAGSNVYADVASPNRANVKGRNPNHLGLYDMSGNVEEWVWNTWSGTIAGGTNPTGPGGHIHNQKTRRGGAGEIYHQLSARQIRSIDGADGGLGFRIALSEDMLSVPAGMVKPREIRRPVMDDRTIANTLRDPRFVTGDSQVWMASGFGTTASRAFKFWETGEVIMGSGFTRALGQWYTVNNHALVIVPNGGGTRFVFGYIVMADGVMSIINDRGFGGGAGGFAPFGRIERTPETSSTSADINRPTIPSADQQTAAQLAASHPNVAMRTTGIDMTNIPQSARGQDPRLITTDNEGWWQTGGGGTHRYRKDINDEFRFVVYQPTGSANMLANGNWFTVNDMFLRVTHPTGGYTVDYLYTISASGQMFHVSFQAYERGDFRNFNKTPNEQVTAHTHIIPRGQPQSFYGGANMNGHSTFMQPPRPTTICPSGCGGTVYDCLCSSLCQACDNHVDNCDCEPNVTCSHGNNPTTCVICNPVTCSHGNNPTTCVICNPVTCSHGNNPTTCVICNPVLCSHGNNPATCVICNPVTCSHGNNPTTCVICNPVTCSHGNNPATCVTCNPVTCSHGNNPTTCVICNPVTCSHGNNPTTCVICNPVPCPRGCGVMNCENLDCVHNCIPDICDCGSGIASCCCDCIKQPQLCEHDNDPDTCMICNPVPCPRGCGVMNCEDLDCVHLCVPYMCDGDCGKAPCCCECEPVLCEHDNDPATCIQCNPQPQLCEHDNDPDTCMICNPVPCPRGCGVMNCTNLQCMEQPDFILGDVNGDDQITILDVLELLKFLAGIENNAITKDGGEGSNAWNAAIIHPPLSQGQRRPAIGDALEILKKLAKIPNNKIDNPDT